MVARRDIGELRSKHHTRAGTNTGKWRNNSFAEFLLYLLVSTIVIAAILGGFVLYASRDAAFVIALILMIALMLLSRALPEPKFDPISLGSIAAGMVTLFLYVASLRSS